MPAIAIGSAAINYEIDGAGDWLVLLHEIGGTLQTWSAVTPALARHFKVLRYDQRGAGKSSAISGAFRIENKIEDLGLLLAQIGATQPVHVAGVAIGSALAAHYAATSPQRVKSVVLACPAPSVSADRVKYLNERAGQVEREGMASNVEGSLANSYPPVVRRDPAAFEAYKARWLASDPNSYAAINRAFAKFDATPDLPNIQCPALVLAGTHDTLRPPDFVRGVAAAIPGSEYREIDSGHVMPVQAPARMVAAMQAFYRGIGAI